MAELPIGATAQRTGWSPRMLRYLEGAGILAGKRSAASYRLYGEAEIDLLARLGTLRERFGFALTDIAFAVRLRREPVLRLELTRWLEAAHSQEQVAWLDWEQRKHAQLLAA